MRCLFKCSVVSILGVVVICLIFINLYVEHNYVLDKRSTIWKLICRESPAETSGQFLNRVTNGNISPVQKRLTSSQQSQTSESKPLHSRPDPTRHDKEVVKQVNRETASPQLNSAQHVHSLKDCYNFLTSINISYHYLVGTPLLEKRYLTIGLSIVKRKKDSYLLETIKSIFEHSSYEEWKEIAVVIHLAEFDSTWCDRMVHNISEKFAYHIINGRLMVIRTPKEYYSVLDGLKRNDNNFEDWVKIRSKQNVDYAFLLNFCANLSDYYIMLEDDIQSGKHFFTIVKEFISSLKGTQWVTLEFSKLGFTGKLYHSQDLPRLTHFLLMFYQEMSYDLLLRHFYRLLGPNEAIHFRPPLFKRFGYKRNKDKLKDDDFEQDPINLPDNHPDM